MVLNTWPAAWSWYLTPQVLAQYRTFLRTARRLPGDQGRDDVVEMVRCG